MTFPSRQTPKKKRFFKQFKALKKGDLGAVKKIAKQAGKEVIKAQENELEKGEVGKQRRLNYPKS